MRVSLNEQQMACLFINFTVTPLSPHDPLVYQCRFTFFLTPLPLSLLSQGIIPGCRLLNATPPINCWKMQETSEWAVSRKCARFIVRLIVKSRLTHVIENVVSKAAFENCAFEMLITRSILFYGNPRGMVKASLR